MTRWYRDFRKLQRDYERDWQARDPEGFAAHLAYQREHDPTEEPPRPPPEEDESPPDDP